METIRTMMKDSIFEVFEKMFFVFLEEDENAPVNYDMEASIDFTSIISGRMRLLFDGDLIRTMTRNMLNMDADDDVSEETLADCAREAVNMVCGNFLTKIDASDKFSLSGPRCMDVDASHSFFGDAEHRAIMVSASGNVGVVVDVTPDG